MTKWLNATKRVSNNHLVTNCLIASLHLNDVFRSGNARCWLNVQHWTNIGSANDHADWKIHLPVFNSVPDRHPVSQLSKSNTTADVYRPAIGLLQVHSTSTHNAAWCAHDKYKNQTFLFWTYKAYILTHSEPSLAETLCQSMYSTKKQHTLLVRPGIQHRDYTHQNVCVTM